MCKDNESKSLQPGQVFAFFVLIGAGLVGATIGVCELIYWLIGG